jgi:polysaccharide export outer membrane protein
MRILFLLIIFIISMPASYPQGKSVEQPSGVKGEVYAYRIKPGDTLEISVYGEPDLTKTTKVSEDGKIIYPFIGEIKVENLTISEAANEIETLLKKDYFINPQVAIFVKEYSKFFIVGAVKQEGRYELKGNLTILDAIALSGGAKEGANLSNIKVIRSIGKEESQYKVNFYTQGKDFLLQPLDRIIVDEFGDISVFGQVLRPGSYKYKRGLSTLDAIAMAGGFTDVANQNAVRVIRTNKAGQKQTFNVPVAQILKSGDKSKDLELKEGDIVSVGESFF